MSVFFLEGGILIHSLIIGITLGVAEELLFDVLLMVITFHQVCVSCLVASFFVIYMQPHSSSLRVWVLERLSHQSLSRMPPSASRGLQWWSRSLWYRLGEKGRSPNELVMLFCR